MAEEISNRTLAILLIVVMAISLGGTIISLNRLTQIGFPIITGAALTDTGTSTVNITSQASIIFHAGNNTVAFGNGWVNSTESSGVCVMSAINSSDGTISTACKGQTASDWAAGLSGFIIENNGNVNLSIQVESDKNSTEFLGVQTSGTNNMAFKFMAYNNETSSCPQLNASCDNEWLEWPNAAGKTGICNGTAGGLGYTDTVDSMVIDLNLSIDYRTNNTGNGTQTATITATGTALT